MSGHKSDLCIEVVRNKPGRVSNPAARTSTEARSKSRRGIRHATPWLVFWKRYRPPPILISVYPRGRGHPEARGRQTTRRNSIKKPPAGGGGVFFGEGPPPPPYFIRGPPGGRPSSCPRPNPREKIHANKNPNRGRLGFVCDA